ncbi:dTDP-4-dehydrorhamnose reductase [Desulfoferula mesophila]|uniref:dTDP-4-dehydrorhamnose reductase n=1 Tax=Desulfoferula mesophila TaxID=3058419 RepID=A0AAU9EGE6_9BACT|nr:NAD(P)-dependent oxidoreductase [Desulfoferula mesophilus]
MADNTKILLFGAGGMLGRELLGAPLPGGLSLVGLTRAQADITSPEQVDRALAEHRPGLVLNAAAFSNVDGAESQPKVALAVNAQGPGNLARACGQAGIPLLQVSTDYVFGGSGQTIPYREDDPPAPLNQYGLTKLRGEQLVRQACPSHLIVRTSWLFGALSRNFIHLMLELMRTRAAIKVVADQVGCPTSAGDLAQGLLRLAGLVLSQREPVWGTYHLSGPLVLNRYEFAQMIWAEACKRLDKDLVIEPVGSEAFAAPAKRPAYSALDCSKIEQTFGLAMEDWRPELARIVEYLQKSEQPPRV